MSATQTKTNHPNSEARRWRRRVLLLAGPVILILGGLFFYLRGGRVVSSDNAYVHADKLTVASEVAGSVVEVTVRDNQHVQVGQLLFKLDDEPYRIARDEAVAQLEAVRWELRTLRGNYQQKLAAIEEAQEIAAYDEREFKRQEELSSNDVATGADLDKARHTLEAAKRHVSVLQQEAATVLANLGGRLDRPDEENPRYAAAKARLDKAERDLRNTVVRAPISGVVANITNLPIGKYLQPAQAAFSIVATDHVWIEANLKETELTYLRPGNPVTVEIDTYPNHKWHGKVSDINPATGAEFSLIPAQNASGNWVKVVQRIPVRVEVEGDDAEYPLRAGMSAQVEIDTGHTRSLKDLARVFGSGEES
ncbi:MAG: HlyD family secretion protein [Nibricoccus sp.]